MAKVGIIICDRNRTCTGGKCFMALHERTGAFRKYPKDEPIEIVGYVACGGCPGERLEFAPAELKKYGAEEIILASCFLAGYPQCPYIEDHIQYIENVVGLPVVVGSHPMPTNYVKAHNAAGDWDRAGVRERGKWVLDDPEAADHYDSTKPTFLKDR